MQRGTERPFQRRRLRYDSSFRAAVGYCYEHALPYSEFMDWDPDDRAIVLAYSLERALVCVSCGTAEWEWDAEQGGDPAAYTAMLMRCPGCASKDIANSTLPTDKQPGSSVRLVPTAVADKMSQTRRKRPKSRRERAGKT